MIKDNEIENFTHSYSKRREVVHPRVDETFQNIVPNTMLATLRQLFTAKLTSQFLCKPTSFTRYYIFLVKSPK